MRLGDDRYFILRRLSEIRWVGTFDPCPHRCLKIRYFLSDWARMACVTQVISVTLSPTWTAYERYEL
jgi:hypothetical protein